MGLAPLVCLAADVGRVGQIAEITHMPEGRTPAGDARAGGLHALASVPLVADIYPREPDPFLLLRSTGAVLVLLTGVLDGAGLFRPGAVERGPVGGQLASGEKPQ